MQLAGGGAGTRAQVFLSQGPTLFPPQCRALALPLAMPSTSEQPLPSEHPANKACGSGGSHHKQSKISI